VAAKAELFQPADLSKSWVMPEESEWSETAQKVAGVPLPVSEEAEIQDWVHLYHFDYPFPDDEDIVYISGPESAQKIKEDLIAHHQEYRGALSKLIFGSIEHHRGETIIRKGFRDRATNAWDIAKLLKQINRDLGCIAVIVNGHAYDNRNGTNLSAMLMREFGMPASKSDNLSVIIQTFTEFLSALKDEDRNRILAFLSSIQQGSAAICMEATMDSILIDGINITMNKPSKGGFATRIEADFGQQIVTVEQDLMLVSEEMQPLAPFMVQARFDIDAGTTQVVWK
jgi:hypothetical protein